MAEESELLRNSVIVLDEFTGFTPIQNRLMEKLLVLAKKVSVSVTMDVREDFYQCRGVHELFAMSKKTVASLLKVAELCKVPVEEPLVLPTGKQRRYANAADLYFMEQNLFRPGAGSYRYKAPEQSMQHIRIMSLKNPREELKFAAREIVRLTRENGYRYRDIAVVTGMCSSMAIMCRRSLSSTISRTLLIRRKIFCSTRLSSVPGDLRDDRI